MCLLPLLVNYKIYLAQIKKLIENTSYKKYIIRCVDGDWLRLEDDTIQNLLTANNKINETNNTLYMLLVLRRSLLDKDGKLGMMKMFNHLNLYINN